MIRLQMQRLLVPFFVISNVGTINGLLTMLERSLTLEKIRLDFHYSELIVLIISTTEETANLLTVCRS